MQGLAPSDIFAFEDFRLDRRGGLFRCNGAGAFDPVAIGSRALDILGVLIERAGEVVSKDEIISAVWPGTVVEDSNLTVQISALRRALDKGRSNGSCIQTVAGRGYRFVLAVTRPAAGEQSSSRNCGPERAWDDARGLVAPLRASSTRIMAPNRRRTIGAAIVAAVGVVLVAAVSAWWVWPTLRPPHTREMASPPSMLQPFVAPRLSIVVLPFANLSNDPEQQYFADGVTEDVTTDLSRIANSFVISRNTAFTYRNKPVDTKQIGRELGVRYLLEGGVRRSGDQLRVTAQLIDAETDGHLWGERFDSATNELFALQDEITSRIAIALKFAMVSAEAARPTANPDALDYIFRARAAGSRPWTRDSLAEVIGLLERASALDPGSAEAQIALAAALTGRVLMEMSDNADADIARAEGLLGQVSPDTALAHWAKGQLLREQHRYADAIPEYEAAIALDRNATTAYASLGHSKLLTGSLEEVVPLVNQAIRLSPRDSDLGYWYDVIGLTHLLQSRTEDAIVWLEKARTASPARPFIRAHLAAAYGIKGESEHAAVELAEARRLSRDPDHYASIARLKAVAQFPFGVPKIRALSEATYFAGLRKAGVPEE
jgi:adenylate cyclase